MAAKKALGRGLEALIPPGAGRRPGVQELPVSALRPNPHQPRRRFGRAELAELAASIREHGVLQPLVVRAAAGGYEVVCGERRLLAAREAGLKTVPCLVREVADDMLLPLALVENLQRDDLNAMEEAAAFKQLVTDYGFTHEEVARAVGKSRAAVTNTLRLLELAPAVQEMVKRGELTAGQARPLVGVQPATRQLALARRIAHQGLSARAAEALAGAGREAGRTRKRRSAAANPYWADIIRRLEERLGTKVTLTGSDSRGAIVLHFFSAAERERLLELLGAGDG